MKKTLGSIASLSVLFFCACSSSSSNGTSDGSTDGGSSADSGKNTCTATAAGGTSGTIPCEVGGASTTGASTTITIDSPDGSDGVSILVSLKNAPTATTYTAATVVEANGAFKSTDKSTEWSNMASSGADTQGTFSLTITDVGGSTDLGGGATGYHNLHGTYTGTFVQTGVGSGGSDAGGNTATLSVKF